MTTIIPPGFGVLSQHFTVSGSTHPVVTTCGFFSPTIDDAVAMSLDFHTAFTSNADAPWRGSNMPVGLDFVKTSILFNKSGIFELGEYLGGGSGSIASGGMPMNTAPLLRKRTGLVGRKFRSNSFLPPVLLDTEVSSAGQITNARRVYLEQQINDIAWAALAIDDYQPVLLHSDPLVLPTVLLPFQVPGKIGTIGRRLR